MINEPSRETIATEPITDSDLITDEKVNFLLALQLSGAGGLPGSQSCVGVRVHVAEKGTFFGRIFGVAASQDVALFERSPNRAREDPVPVAEIEINAVAGQLRLRDRREQDAASQQYKSSSCHGLISQV